jgi:hypothetical protein
MLNKIIPIDFVAGSHGHFLEVTLNKFFGFTPVFDSFTNNGTSHVAPSEYVNQRVFQAEHWFELYPDKIKNVPKLISIRHSAEDLLLLSSVSLLRAGDLGLDNDQLEVDTYNKLNNIFYKDTLDLILKSYPFLVVDEKNSSIPRNILREFYKFGFANTDINGYWIKQQSMQYSTNTKVLYFDFADFYNLEKFVEAICKIEQFVDKKFNFCNEFYESHNKFLNFITCRFHKQQCDQLVQNIVDQKNVEIPKLTLFQESYMNACLENIYKKEMPFHNPDYFTSTKDVLHYLNNQAPNL